MKAREVDNLLMQGVLEFNYLYKYRDHPKRPVRCTKCIRILGDPTMRARLGFHPARGHANFVPYSYNEVIVWDLDRRAYRTIYCGAIGRYAFTPAEDYLRRELTRDAFERNAETWRNFGKK